MPSSGWENRITWGQIFTSDIAKKLFGPEASQIMALLADKDRDQEDHTIQEEAKFSRPGALTVSESGPWVPRVGGTLVEVLCALRTAGSSNTVVTIYKNGASIGTITLGSGTTIAIQRSFNTTFNVDTDIMHAAITTAGTGAAHLTVFGRLV